ncbi:PASTA domain-containing protein [Streptomyces tropicalis]|uniref:PASTA domain-containing protein n=1 Tax=Streptomyces tropicalis TaxID=3034234 RepID=A0ABT6A6S1_9ACTN|nr:PASTA domain-containing protein [Streptomyces tropicalis]MDF3300142.1 PASTA domain-containing protein [Streptomyces tropicalis]
MNRKTLACTAAIITLALATACQPTQTTGNSGSSAAASSSSSSAGDNSNGSTAKKTVPNFVGMGLQSAQDAAQEANFYNLTSHDSLGRDRMQILDRDWKVCTQSPKAGTSASTDVQLDFGAVKLAESCPAHDQAAPSAAGGSMPDFHGKSVRAARAALDSGTSITVNDASGTGRLVLIESNWQVCSQTPSAGTKVNGQPVTLNAVKYGESCP